MSNLPPSLVDKTVAVLGGTGPQGRGLARRFAAAGLPVVIGSRSAERAAATADELAAATGGAVTGADNAGAAIGGDIVVVVNTVGPTLSGTEGLGDWNIPWPVWKAGNANT